MLADARSFGMDDASIAQLAAAMQPQQADDDGVWPDNVATVNAFLLVASQWRVVAIGGGMAPAMPMFIGLDYAAVRVALDAEEIPVTPQIWRGLRVMEQAACAALNETDR